MKEGEATVLKGETEIKLDAKMTLGQAQRKEKDPWTTNPWQ